jgi:uncharacterized protein YecE (DUF72 family)
MLPLKDKTLALLIQLPPSLKISEGIENIRQYIVPELDSSNFRYAVEVRDRSWFQDLAYNFFADNNICMGMESTCRIKNYYGFSVSQIYW